MIPIVSIVGKSNSGKTTFIEKIIPVLNKRGYKIGVVKHDVHGFEIDHEGKDSYRLKRAGAKVVIISSPNKIAIVKDVDHDHSLSEIKDLFEQEVDIIISEGYKKDIQPKIEVFRKEVHHGLMCNKEDDNLIAVVSNKKFNNIDVPCFDLDDVEKIANFLEEIIIKNKKEKELKLIVDGKDIMLTTFVEKFLRNSVIGMVSSLKGCEDPKDIKIIIN